MEFEYKFVTNFFRPLSATEAEFFEQVIGYACKSGLRLAESPSFCWDGYNTSVEVYPDTTKTYSDDISFLFEEFWDNVETYLNEGSPKYKRARNGNPAGYQLIKPHDTMNYSVIKSIQTDTVTTEEIEDEDKDAKVIKIEVPSGAKEVTVTFKL